MIKSKCEKILNQIVSESVDNNSIKYKAYGFFEIVVDDFDKGEELDAKDSGMFEDFFGETPVQAVERLAYNYNLKLKADDFEISELNGKTEIDGSFYLDENEKYVDITSDKETFEAWKNGKIILYAYHYQIIIQKLVYSNLTKDEIDQLYNSF